MVRIQVKLPGPLTHTICEISVNEIEWDLRNADIIHTVFELSFQAIVNLSCTITESVLSNTAIYQVEDTQSKNKIIIRLV